MSGLDAQPRQYEDRVVGFLDDSLRVQSPAAQAG